MVLFEDALGIVLSQVVPTGCEHIAFNDSLGRFLAEDIFSDMDMPPFDKSAVDGFACRMEDILPAGPTPLISGTNSPLKVIETIAAGVEPMETIRSGQCSKIMTGAMVPPGADCVIMVEDTDADHANQVRFTGVSTGKNICYRGEDIKAGDRVLQKGHRVTPATIAALAAVGAVNPLVAKLPAVAIISTGDELVEPGITPQMAQIRNSNAWQLEAQLKTVPALPSYHGIVSDDSPSLRRMIESALERNQVVLLTGGVSMGDFDFVPAVMQDAGIGILFKSVAIQPGKPTVFGRRGDKFVFGLPGNPVSSFVLFELMVKPFLHAMMGSDAAPEVFQLPMGVDFSRRKSARKSVIPVTIRNGEVFPAEYHGSAHINAYTVANGLLTIDIGKTNIIKGEIVNVRPV